MKAYGNSANPAVLCVHGIQDNCDTFVTLLPLVPDDYYYVCVDLPGHGRSAPFPAHVSLEFVDYVSAVKWTADHFGWTDVAYVGHSFGGALGTWFAGVYAERVRCLIALDTMGPRPVETDVTVAEVRGRVDGAQSLHRRHCGDGGPPAYTFDEAVAKMMSGRSSRLTLDSARALARRGLVRADAGGDKYTFASDQRLKLPVYPLMTFDQHRRILSEIACPAMYVLADQNCGRYATYMRDAYEFHSGRPNATVVVVAGDHDVHLNHPDRVSGHVSDFLRRHYNNNN